MKLIKTFLIALARTSNTMLHTGGKSDCSYLIPDLRGKATSFSPRSMMLAGGSSICGLRYVEVYSFYTRFVEFLIIDGCQILSNSFSAYDGGPPKPRIYLLKIVYLF